LYEKTFSYSAKVVRDKLRSSGFPMIAETRSPREALQEKHWEVRKTFLEIGVPGYGTVTIPAHPPRMSESPPAVRWIKCGLGEDNEAIGKRYGLET